MARAEPELAANAMLCAVNQAAYLLKRQIQSQGRAFLRQGGFAENLSRRRLDARREAAEEAESDQSDGSDRSDRSDKPPGRP